MIKTFRKIMSPLSNEFGVLDLVAAGVLAMLALFYAAYSNDLLPNLDGYRQYAHDVASENPENADPNDLHDALDATKETLKPSPPLTTPWDVSAWLEYLAYKEITDLVEQNVNTPTPDSKGLGKPEQEAACGISVSPVTAAPGEFVTATITVATPFKSRIASISGSAGGEGFSVNPAGGSYAFSVPGGYCSQSLAITYEAYGPTGIVCSGAATVTVDLSSPPDTDGDGVRDACDPDDDNDGTPDGADCAPLDPDRHPGKDEVCGDGIDQDCDGQDKPCTPAPLPCIPANGCCPEYPQVCGPWCIRADADCCGGSSWCYPGNYCCNGHCCPTGAGCCGAGCCQPGTECCPGETSCCPSNRECCGAGCCPVGYRCTSNQQCTPM